MVRTTSPSLPIRMKAFGTKSPEAQASPCPNGKLRLNTRPPPTPALLARKRRRDRLVSPEPGAISANLMSASTGVRVRGKLDRLADSHIGPAAADVPTHGVVDISVGGMRIAGQQC